MLKFTGCGQTAATNAASASAATSCGLEAFRSPDGANECAGSALHVHKLKSLSALSDVGSLPWQQPPGEVRPDSLFACDEAQCRQPSPLDWHEYPPARSGK